MSAPRRKRYCPECDAERLFRRETRDEVFKVRGEDIVLQLPVHTCEECGEWIVDESYDRDPVDLAYEEYRRRKGLLTPGQILEIRERYKLSQRSFAALLGMSQATINRYERGALQDEAHDVAIRPYANVENMRGLVRRRGDLLSANQRRRVDGALASVGSIPRRKLKTLFARLKRAGLGRAFVESRVLPAQWPQIAARSMSSLEELEEYLSVCLGLDKKMIAAESIAISAPPQQGILKVRKGIAKEKLKASMWVAVRAASAACKAIPVRPKQLPPDASTIRKEILRSDRDEWVNLANLLDFCWYRAIPVLHLPKLPGSKMDGLSGYVEGRPVIVLCRNRRQSAWLLFDLAHELGHIVCGHIKSGSILLDERVERDSTDKEEKEANAFAVELLTGSPETLYAPAGKYLTGRELAAAAKEASEEHHVDPGVVVMNYAWGQQFFPVGVAALNELEPKANAPRTILERMQDYLEWDQLSDHLKEFLIRVTAPVSPTSGPES